MKKFIIGLIIFVLLILIAAFSQKNIPGLLQELTLHQQHSALVMELPPQSKCLLVSNIQGDINSLNRILDQWRSMGLLNQTTIQDHTYIIFNGNCIGSNGYNAKIIATIATLMKANPSHVFYLQGPHESKEWWLDKIALSPTVLRAFFNSLPLGLYIFTQDKELPIRVSYRGQEEALFATISCKSLHNGTIKAFCTLGELCSYKQGKIAYFIVGETSGIDWSTMQGLQQKDTTWHLVSSPIREYKEKYRFFNNAFALLTIGNTLSECTLALYYTDPAQPNTFIEGKVSHL